MRPALGLSLAALLVSVAGAAPAHAGLVGPAILRETGPPEIDLYAAHYPYYHGGHYWRYHYNGGYYNYRWNGHYYPYHYGGRYCYHRRWYGGAWGCY